MTGAASPAALQLNPARFAGCIDGKPVGLVTLSNSRGMVVGVTNYGAKIEQIIVPDRNGKLDDVVLGYSSLAGALEGSPSMGAFIGRYAGRLANACFSLDGCEHRLSANEGRHCLHGGVKGLQFQVFDVVRQSRSSVEMRYLFADGEEGFPGALALLLTYSVLESNELVLDYEATALDKPTVASFTTHAFFNLDGESSSGGSNSVLKHEVMICADRYFALDDELVATGQLLPVDNTLHDFRNPTVLGSRVRRQSAGAGLSSSGQFRHVPGYDSCYLVNRSSVGGLALCARVTAPISGRVMEVWSTEPAIQFYTGLLPDEALPGGLGKGGRRYRQQQGLCLEPQAYPNAPNCPTFPASLYAPGQTRAGQTIYRFGCQPAPGNEPGPISLA